MNNEQKLNPAERQQLNIADVSGSKLDNDAIFVELNETNCKLCRYYKSESDNVCIQNCERLGLTGYYR